MVASPAGRDLSALRALGRFCAAQGLEVTLAPEVVEAFVVAGLHGRAPWTKGTYRSTLRSMAGRPRPALATPFPPSPALAPYTSAEVAELASIAAAQPSAYRRASALCFLALGIGAGLRPGELVGAVGPDIACRRGGIEVKTAGRAVPVTGCFADVLARAARQAGAGHLFRPGRAGAGSKNLVNGLAEDLRADPAAPKLSSGRARSTFICSHLAAGTPLRELLYVAGIVEVESLLRYCRHVPGAPGSKAELRRRLRQE